MKQAQFLCMPSWTNCHICAPTITKLLILKHGFHMTFSQIFCFLLFSCQFLSTSLYILQIQPSPLLSVLILVTESLSFLAPSLHHTLHCQLHYHHHTASTFSTLPSMSFPSSYAFCECTCRSYLCIRISTLSPSLQCPLINLHLETYCWTVLK